ncbi:chorismate-binding protein [Nocardioides sp. NPDC127514]|uniref:chorismate-binding protein n=1 Tax=Nocardioides sp. NPDC127514 TaxID=3154243 RepID=UPI00332DC954
MLDPDEDPFTVLDLTPPALGGGFGGGWIGSFGYRLGRLREDVGPALPSSVPVARLAFYDRVLVREHGRWWYERLTGHVDPGRCADRDARFRRDLEGLVAGPACVGPASYEVGDFSSAFGEVAHAASIRRVRDAIVDGDLFQANITQRIEADFRGNPLDVFVRGWRELEPDFAAYVGWPGAEIASFSPELFLRRRGRSITSSPIKGTAPTAADPRDLVSSAKDRAENVMIVDLMRNDLARVCTPGSVEVPALNRVEEHSVRHLVSDVTGALQHGVGDGEVLRCAFPPGSVTGAPKVAAMRLIDALEPQTREAYTGAIGYVSPGAGMELSVTIRTLEFSPGQVWMGVGGGITALSDDRLEVEECRVKAEPVLRAIGSRWPRTSSQPRVEVARPPRPAPVRTMPTALELSRIRKAFDEERRPGVPRVLVVDNYDSFVHMIVHQVIEAGAVAVVVRNDALTPDDVVLLRRSGTFTHLLLSPGPFAPAEAGICVPLVRALAATTPVLGVCLGHQAIGEAFGARVVRAGRVVHGMSDVLSHDGEGLLHGLPASIRVARYHSLTVGAADLPSTLEPTSWSSDGELMGVRHRLHTHVEGLQWHPESILTEHGQRVIEAFVNARVSSHIHAPATEVTA